MRVLRFTAFLLSREFFAFIYVMRHHLFTLPWIDVVFWYQFMYFFRSPHAVARLWMQKKGLDTQTFNHSYVYGETPLRTWDMLIKRLALQKGDVVFDVGCGSGLGCLFVSRRLKARAVGVDFNEDLIFRAERLRKRTKDKKVVFLHGDARHIDYGDADAVYLFSTTFTLELMQALSIRFRQTLKYGALVVSVSVPLKPRSEFRIIDTLQAPFFFGDCMIFVHRFVGDPLEVTSTEQGDSFAALLDEHRKPRQT